MELFRWHLPLSFLPLLLLCLLLAGHVVHASVYMPRRFPLQPLSVFERSALRACPCEKQEQCLPVAGTGATAASQREDSRKKKEVFAFSVTTTDQWKHYDWEQLTTVAWNEDKELLCHAHSKGVKIVIKHNFDDVETLCDPQFRKQWIQETYERIVNNYADGVNIDTEKAMHGDAAKCMTTLVQELRQELLQHAFTQHAQITFDVSWAPRGVDGRYYQWKELADAVDFLFVMSYDMRSQIYYQCLAAANSPLALVKQGLEEFLFGFGIAPEKLVLGVPWYGYKYTCADAGSQFCLLEPTPFFGAPCSDAAGAQVDFGGIETLIAREKLPVQWDEMTQSPFVVSENGSFQIWFDNPRSLTLKYQLVKELGLHGAGMWNADTLDYTSNADDDGARTHETQAMWEALHAIS